MGPPRRPQTAKATAETRSLSHFGSRMRCVGSPGGVGTVGAKGGAWREQAPLNSHIKSPYTDKMRRKSVPEVYFRDLHRQRPRASTHAPVLPCAGASRGPRGGARPHPPRDFAPKPGTSANPIVNLPPGIAPESAPKGCVIDTLRSYIPQNTLLVDIRP